MRYIVIAEERKGNGKPLVYNENGGFRDIYYDELREYEAETFSFAKAKAMVRRQMNARPYLHNFRVEEIKDWEKNRNKEYNMKNVRCNKKIWEEVFNAGFEGSDGKESMGEYASRGLEKILRYYLEKEVNKNIKAEINENMTLKQIIKKIRDKQVKDALEEITK